MLYIIVKLDLVFFFLGYTRVALKYLKTSASKTLGRSYTLAQIIPYSHCEF